MTVQLYYFKQWVASAFMRFKYYKRKGFYLYIYAGKG